MGSDGRWVDGDGIEYALIEQEDGKRVFCWRRIMGNGPHQLPPGSRLVLKPVRGRERAYDLIAIWPPKD